MRILFACLLCSLATSAWSKNLKVGPYIGHQNSKGHAKGVTTSGDQVITDPSTGIDSVSPNSQQSYNFSDTSFDNSNVQGMRLSYDLDFVTLRSDLSFSRFYPDNMFSRDKTSFSLGVQYDFFTTAEAIWADAAQRIEPRTEDRAFIVRVRMKTKYHRSLELFADFCSHIFYKLPTKRI